MRPAGVSFSLTGSGAGRRGGCGGSRALPPLTNAGRGWPLGFAACILLYAGAGSAAEPALALGPCEAVLPGDLADALVARLGRAVAMQIPSEAMDGDTWSLEVLAAPGGARLTLRSPAGDVWRREVGWGEDAGPEGRVRTVALAAQYLLALAESPFVAGPPPGAVVPPMASAATTAAPIPSDGAAESTIPVVAPPNPPDSVGEASAGVPPPGEAGAVAPWLGAAVRAGGSADLSDRSRGRSRALLLGLRLDVEWPSGVWLEAEVDWHFAEESRPETLRLFQAPIRVGAGASIPVGEWRVRIGLQAVVEGWWTSGGASRSGWRPGGGLVISGARYLLPWLVVGAELGIDLLPPGVELIHGETTVFSLGAWRWRGSVWVGFGSRVGV